MQQRTLIILQAWASQRTAPVKTRTFSCWVPQGLRCAIKFDMGFIEGCASAAAAAVAAVAVMMRASTDYSAAVRVVLAMWITLENRGSTVCRLDPSTEVSADSHDALNAYIHLYTLIFADSENKSSFSQTTVVFRAIDAALNEYRPSTSSLQSVENIRLNQGGIGSTNVTTIRCYATATHQFAKYSGIRESWSRQRAGLACNWRQRVMWCDVMWQCMFSRGLTQFWNSASATWHSKWVNDKHIEAPSYASHSCSWKTAFSNIALVIVMKTW